MQRSDDMEKQSDTFSLIQKGKDLRMWKNKVKTFQFVTNIQLRTWKSKVIFLVSDKQAKI